MNVMNTRKTAILVDGGFYRKRAERLWGKEKSAPDRAEELFRYCLLHLERTLEPRDLYRIFYYDCPPMTREMKHPLTGETINYSEKDGTKWAREFYQELMTKRKLALRMGELAESQAKYTLKEKALQGILSGEKNVSDLSKYDFRLDVKQKGVDMRIGLDVASLAQGRYVDQIILIAGDSDFIPVAKMARRNGIDFILDPMGQNIKAELSKHIDGIETYTGALTDESGGLPNSDPALDETSEEQK